MKSWKDEVRKLIRKLQELRKSNVHVRSLTCTLRLGKYRVHLSACRIITARHVVCAQHGHQLVRGQCVGIIVIEQLKCETRLHARWRQSMHSVMRELVGCSARCRSSALTCTRAHMSCLPVHSRRHQQMLRAQVTLRGSLLGPPSRACLSHHLSHRPRKVRAPLVRWAPRPASARVRRVQAVRVSVLASVANGSSRVFVCNVLVSFAWWAGGDVLRSVARG